jgi:hypothetical protein
MRLFAFIFAILVISSGVLPSSVLAQSAVCNNPQSCENLHCQKTCVDVWENGTCEGGYCAQGMVFANPFAREKAGSPTQKTTGPLVQEKAEGPKPGSKDLVIHQASPALQKKIQDLLSSK